MDQLLQLIIFLVWFTFFKICIFHVSVHKPYGVYPSSSKQFIPSWKSEKGAAWPVIYAWNSWILPSGLAQGNVQRFCTKLRHCYIDTRLGSLPIYDRNPLRVIYKLGAKSDLREMSWQATCALRLNFTSWAAQSAQGCRVRLPKIFCSFENNRSRGN